MNVLISVDMEGISGVVASDHTSLSHKESLNGLVVGETGLNAALAGAYGRPVVLVTGDRAATEEARALLGNIETVTVKDGVMRTAARCLHPQVAQKQIREAAQRALRLNVAPFVVSPPITLRVVFQRASHADMAALIPTSRWVDGRTVEWVGKGMPAVYEVFRAMMVLSLAVER
ncbi:M55 family metallopeptidase [Dehalococcoidia bacterium]|nr:M55 family metallopeptidase [Dehalococcoidia bacterium]